MAAGSGKSSVPSGWYPDPNNSAINRWWSGSEWTRDVSPRETLGNVAEVSAKKVATRADSLAAEARSSAGTATRSASDAFENPVATARAQMTGTATSTATVARPATPANSAASYAASSARPSAPAAPFRAPARSRPAPEIMQPPYAFNRTMSTFALIAVIVGLGLIAGLLLG